MVIASVADSSAAATSVAISSSVTAAAGGMLAIQRGGSAEGIERTISKSDDEPSFGLAQTTIQEVLGQGAADEGLEHCDLEEDFDEEEMITHEDPDSPLTDEQMWTRAIEDLDARGPVGLLDEEDDDAFIEEDFLSDLDLIGELPLIEAKTKTALLVLDMIRDQGLAAPRVLAHGADGVIFSWRRGAWSVSLTIENGKATLEKTHNAGIVDVQDKDSLAQLLRSVEE